MKDIRYYEIFEEQFFEEYLFEEDPYDPRLDNLPLVSKIPVAWLDDLPAISKTPVDLLDSFLSVPKIPVEPMRNTQHVEDVR